jgi:hypothetical protein
MSCIVNLRRWIAGNFCLGILSVIVLVLTASTDSIGARGIVGAKAPSLDGVQTWYGFKKNQKPPDIRKLKGKVLYLFFFQSWCPGGHSHGFPALKKTHEKFSKRDEVVFIAVQTVFEGFSVNTNARALQSAESFGLPIPVGHDPGPLDKGSVIMRRYRTGGTPWTVIVDKQGVVRFNGFRIDDKSVARWIERLLASLSETVSLLTVRRILSSRHFSPAAVDTHGRHAVCSAEV